ncbi:MAG: carbohydrate-binding domain-containing protein [Lachnospiraceae bacterium]
MKVSIRLFAAFFAFSLLLTGCTNTSAPADSASDIESNSDTSSAAAGTSAPITAEYFSARDFEVGYDESQSAIITLSGDTATSSSNAVQISGSTVTITDEGTYILSGTLDDGMIIVNSEKTDKTQLVLKDVSIHSETSAAIYVLQSDKVFITTAADTTNTLSNGGTFTAIDENNIDAVIYSREDITLNGSGTLVVSSPAGHGVVSKDSLTVTSGIYEINCASHGFEGKDDICIANADFTIVSGKDGIHAENADDASLGFVYIQSGTFDISAEGDGISAASYMQIEDGSFNLLTGGGSVNGETKTSEAWGSFMGGGRHSGVSMGNSMGKGKGSMPSADNMTPRDNMPPTDNMPSGDSTAATTTAAEDSTSIKGIKAGGNLVINEGKFTIDSADDSIHSNTSLEINGGVFEIASGDDAFHADENLTVNAGTIHISKSYEGLEGLHVCITGGEITLVASDDGLNAAGGTDSSGMGGRGSDKFGSGNASSNGSVVIAGGTLYIEASGDGIDANGTLEITGGYTTVCGPTIGDTATLDYDSSGSITGGTFIGTGSSRMAQTFTDSTQGVITVQVGSQAAGTAFTLLDSEGNTVLTATPGLPYETVILSSPQIQSNETYRLTVGSFSEELTAS